ncbi:MAG: GMC family oxidoreductase [Proteobacteria bacterium]|nr:GMC family oxidoreductase [Pseudomonadota bacterium]
MTAAEHSPWPDGVFSGEQLSADTAIDCDVAIVGSGAGGATLGAELAESGLDVAILEEGPYVTTADFTSRAAATIGALYRDGGATIALGKPTMMYQEGRVVGGSTVINGGMSWRTPDSVLERWHRQHRIDGIRAADMEPFFARVEERIHVSHQDPETIGRDNELLRAGAEAMGWNVIGNLRNQMHCAGSNNCAFGCPTGAKQSALVTYIPRALAFGARVYSRVRALRISRAGKRATGVEARVVRQDGRLGARIRVRSRLVVSACGAIHTPALLGRSGFRSPSRQIGKNLSMHPNCKLIAIFDRDVRGWEGVHQAFQVREFQDRGLVFAAVNVPPGIVAMSAPYAGRELGEFMRDYNRMVVAGALVEDTRFGRVWVDPTGQPRALYQLCDRDADTLREGVALLGELLFAAGAKRIILPFAGHHTVTSADQARALARANIPKASMELFTVHMMGTARMGEDRSSAVTDSAGRVHDADRLFVCDASLFPGPIGVNPMLTIQALATRSAAHILDNYRRYLS